MGKRLKQFGFILAMVLWVVSLARQSEISTSPTLSNEKQNESEMSLILADFLSQYAPEVSNQILDTFLLNNKSKNDYVILKSARLKAANYRNLKQTNLAENELKEALRFAENQGNLPAQCAILIDLGNLYLDSIQPQKSLLFLQAASKIAQETNDTTLLINALFGLSEIYNKHLKTSEGKADLDTIIFLSKKQNNTFFIAKSWLALAMMEHNSGNLIIEKRILLKSDSLLSDTTPTNLKLEILNHLAASFAQAGDYLTAHDYLTKADSLQRKMHKSFLISNANSLTHIQSTTSQQSRVSVKLLSIVSIILFFGLIATLWLIIRLRKESNILQKKVNQYHQRTNELTISESNFKETVDLEKKKLIEKQKNDLTLINETLPKLTESLELSSQADYLKDVFLAKLSHEVRSPLTTILGFSALLETELALMDKPELYEFASSITQSGNSLLELLDNIFDLSLVNSNKLKLNITAFNLHKSVLEIVFKFEKDSTQKGIRIITNIDTEIQLVSDLGLLTRIITMVIDNALRFTEKGFIKISSTVNNDDNTVTLTIKDTGVGIDKVYLKDIFEPYRKEKLGYSTHYQGSGLSLPLAFKMLGLLHGNIHIDSEIGVGTTINITVPMETRVST